MRVKTGGKTFEIPDERVRGCTSRTGHIGDTVERKKPLPVARPAPAHPKYDSKWEERYAKQALFIPGPLPGMNDYISTGSRLTYNNEKKKWHARIAGAIEANGLGPMPCAWFRFHWREKNRRRNPDNFAAIGKKFIFDALVQNGVLANDGWDEILGWEDRWSIDTLNPGVYVEMFDSTTGGSHADQD